MPTPKPDETQNEWMSRCVPAVQADGAASSNDQAVAMCAQMWRDRDKSIGTDPIMRRAWSTAEIKRVSTEDKREIAGIASTPQTDRMGDIVEPLGLEYTNPLPLLWQHQSSMPVGWAKLNKATKDGVSFSAKFAEIEEPGRLKDRVDEAWQSIKAGLVRGISIGFRALEQAWMDEGGIRFTRAEVVEVSLVTIPANASATIETIKSCDAASLADARKLPAEGTAPKPEPRKVKPMPPTIAEQISAFETRRNAAGEQRKAIMAKAAETGRTLDDAEAQEYDGLATEVKNIDSHLARLRELEIENKAAAVPVNGGSIDDASKSRQKVQQHPVIKITNSHLPPATAFIRFCLASMAGKGSRSEAYEYAKGRKDWHSSTPEILQLFEDQAHYFMRAAVPAGTTTDSTWAAPLVVAQNVTAEFAEFLRPQTIIGRIPGLRRVPFNIQLPRATGGTSAGWVGEAAPKPLTSMTFDTLTLRWAKAAAISVLTEELVRFSNPAAEEVVRTDLARGIVQFLDRQFVDPAVAEVTNVSPGSITNGITAITASGTNMAAFRADMKTLFTSLLDDNQSLATGVFIMTQQQAMSLALAQNSLGQIIFPTINPDTGGTLLGYPVITSENLPAFGGSPADGYPIIFVVANEILLADDGVVTVDASREASLQMDSTPDSPPSASTNMVSLWQLNMLGLRAERWITWKRRRSTAVAWIQNAKYAE